MILTYTSCTKTVCTVKKIIMSTSLQGLSWPDKFTAEFSKESQTLIYVKS